MPVSSRCSLSLRAAAQGPAFPAPMDVPQFPGMPAPGIPPSGPDPSGGSAGRAHDHKESDLHLGFPSPFSVKVKPSQACCFTHPSQSLVSPEFSQPLLKTIPTHTQKSGIYYPTSSAVGAFCGLRDLSLFLIGMPIFSFLSKGQISHGVSPFIFPVGVT